MRMSTASREITPDTYRYRADQEAYLLNRFIYRDYKKRLLPFLARATKGFEYQPPTYSMSSRTDRWGNLFYVCDDTPKLVSPILLPSEPKKNGDTEVVTGWQIDVDAPPTWAARLLGPYALSRLALNQAVQTTGPEQAEPVVTTVPGLTYPLNWAELNLDQVMPEDPNDELYALHFETLKDIRTVFGNADR